MAGDGLLSIDVIKKRLDDIEEYDPKRLEVFEDIEKMINLEDDSLPNYSGAEKVVSPDPRNATLGGERLLTATTPRFKCNEEKNTGVAKADLDALEKMANMLWSSACRQIGRQIEKDAARSAIRYDELHIAVKSVKVMMDQAQGRDKKRLEQVYKRTPVLFKILKPAQCFAAVDDLGLSFHGQKREANVFEVRAAYPELKLADKKDTDTVTLREYWDSQQYAVTTDSGDEFKTAAHAYPDIPIVFQTFEGDDTLTTSKDYAKRQPVLYTAKKSGIWELQNLTMTLEATNMASIGAFAQFILESDDENAKVDINWDIMGGVLKLKRGERLNPLNKQAVDPSVQMVYERMTNLMTESTFYKQAFGQSLGSNATFSTVSLLSQAGRLPLVSYQQGLQWAIGKAMWLALQIVRQDGGKFSLLGAREEFDSKKIPEQFDIEAILEVEQPQDEQMNATLAKSTEGTLSLEDRLERYLGIEQPQQAVRNMYKEQLIQMMVGEMMKQRMQQQSTQTIPTPGASQVGGGIQSGGMMPTSNQAGGGAGALQPMPGNAGNGVPMAGPMGGGMPAGATPGGEAGLV
jgi:hypothetical protein